MTSRPKRIKHVTGRALERLARAWPSQAEGRLDALHETLIAALVARVAMNVGAVRGLWDTPPATVLPTPHCLAQLCGCLAEARLTEYLSPLANVAKSRDFHTAWVATERNLASFEDVRLEALGNIYEHAIAHRLALDPQGVVQRVKGTDRRRSGSFFTPAALTREVVRRALEGLEPEHCCDPALGGGAFLLEVARQLSSRHPERPRAEAVEGRLFGVDVSGLAVAVAELCLWLFVGDRDFPCSRLHGQLVVGDSLLDEAEHGVTSIDFASRFPSIFPGGFDLVVGNPPWVAFAGRAAQSLPPALRAHYRRRYSAFQGYPTLHALFVQRASELASRGRVALLLPSPLADLAGYAPARRSITQRHAVWEPLPEFGQDAFEGVTQSCFALIADARATPAAGSVEPFRLIERPRAQSEASVVEPPEAIRAWLDPARPRLPAETFGERGFQSTRDVTGRLFLRAEQPREPFSLPLLEGRNVGEFEVRSPRLFLHPDPVVLSRSRARLRDPEQYAAVDFVVRQTAAFPIAALHDGTAFRNSLIAGFATPAMSAELLVGLLNSELFRALHVARTRDARQAVFPQVKVGHLRALPLPPARAAERARVEGLAQRLSAGERGGLLREQLEQAVFELFELSPGQALEVRGFLESRMPKALAAASVRQAPASGTLAGEGRARW